MHLAEVSNPISFGNSIQYRLRHKKYKNKMKVSSKLVRFLYRVRELREGIMCVLPL